jgi:hypothetical protein
VTSARLAQSAARSRRDPPVLLSLLLSMAVPRSVSRWQDHPGHCLSMTDVDRRQFGRFGGTRSGPLCFDRYQAGLEPVRAWSPQFGRPPIGGRGEDDEQSRIPRGHSGQPQVLGRGRGAGRDRWSSGVYGHGARRFCAPLGDPAVGKPAGATPQRDREAQVAAGQGRCLCRRRGMAERTPEPVVPVLGKRAAAVALILDRGNQHRGGPGGHRWLKKAKWSVS